MVRPKSPQIEDREYADTFYPRSPELSFLIRGGRTLPMGHTKRRHHLHPCGNDNPQSNKRHGPQTGQERRCPQYRSTQSAAAPG